jgi:hypothetical protein
MSRPLREKPQKRPPLRAQTVLIRNRVVLIEIPVPEFLIWREELLSKRGCPVTLC